SRERAPVLLHYRPWRGRLGPPRTTVWPVARTALGMLFRRKLFWGLYGLGLMFFLLFFFGQYLMVPLETQTTGAPGAPANGSDWLRVVRRVLKCDASGACSDLYFGY